MIPKKKALELIISAKKAEKVLVKKKGSFPDLAKSFELVITEYRKLIALEERVKYLKRGDVTNKIEKEILSILNNTAKEEAVMDILSETII